MSSRRVPSWVAGLVVTVAALVVVLGSIIVAGSLAAAVGLAGGDSGTAPGTAANPRVIRIVAGPDVAFHPASISVTRGETVTFVVTTMGPASHEFMVGPADAVAGDVDGTPELEGIGMMQTRSLTYTFDGAGPYAFACHVEGHYEAGMRGKILVIN